MFNSVLKNGVWLVHLPLCNRLVSYIIVFSINYPFPVLLLDYTVPTVIDTSSWSVVSSVFCFFVWDWRFPNPLKTLPQFQLSWYSTFCTKSDR